MNEPFSEMCWESLLTLAVAIKKSQEPIDFCTVTFGSKNCVILNAFPSPESGGPSAAFFLKPDFDRAIPGHVHAAFRVENFIQITEIVPSRLPEEITRMLKIYAPYCFASLYSRTWGRTFAVSHMAQTLDGRIATVTGDSKWIGSRGNFVHAHRMRALVDGILIGSKTLVKDRPQLTVRHVKGKNPCPIIVGSSPRVLNDLLRSRTDPVVFIGSNAALRNKRIKALHLNRKNGIIRCSDILKSLYSEGIFSIYIEGGSITASHFLEEGAIDILQLHLSPLMLGSGISSFSLPIIRTISAAVRFRDQIFVPVDNGMMFVGIPEPDRNKGELYG